MAKHLPAMVETQVQSLDWEDPLEKEMATHSSILPWKIPRTEELGRATVHRVAKSRIPLSDFTFISFFSPGVDWISGNHVLGSFIANSSSFIKVLQRDCSNSKTSSGSTSNFYSFLLFLPRVQLFLPLTLKSLKVINLGWNQLLPNPVNINILTSCHE